MSERTEQPTPRRLLKALEEGQRPRSRVLGALLPLLAASVAGLRVDSGFSTWARAVFSLTSTPGHLLEQGIVLWGRACGPLLACAMGGALAAGLLQGGLAFDLRHLAPKGQRLDWLAGVKRVLSLKALPDSLRPALAVLVVLTMGASALTAALARCRAEPRLEGVWQFQASLFPIADGASRLAIVLAALALADLLLARWLHARGLRMTREEVKQEHKQQEGDPHHKSKRKAFHRQLALAGPVRSVAQATVVVVNPTHIAVALRYAPAECAAPYVVARGREDVAFEIRKAARAMRVPIVRDVPLARGLIHCEVGDEIPEELFRAAAAILKTVLPLAVSTPPTGAQP